MILRVVLDVNVWVSHYVSLMKNRRESAAQALVRASFAGQCRLGPVQPILSHLMLDTLRGVLLRLGLPETLAETARDAVEAAAIGGIVPTPPYGVLGGGVQPIHDPEDGGVLDTAVAGQADLLVTQNLRDFLPGPRADLDATVVRPDVLLLRHGRLPHGLVIASVYAAKAWLLDGLPPPAGVLERFVT
jgi:predicted nucleic acid-binding protein